MQRGNSSWVLADTSVEDFFKYKQPHANLTIFLTCIQEAFEEECHKHDQSHAKLTSKLKSKTQQLAEKDAELAAKSTDLVTTKALLEAAQKTADAGQKQVGDLLEGCMVAVHAP